MEGKVVVEIVDKDKKEGGNNKTAVNTKTGDTKTEQDDDDVLIISSALAYKAFRTTVSQVKTIATYEIDKSFTFHPFCIRDLLPSAFLNFSKNF